MAVAIARWLVLFLAVSAAAWASAAAAHVEKWKAGGSVGSQVVQKEKRRVVAASEAGTVTAADVADAAGTVYRLQFITMDPGALFLPVQLHADMVFYVHSGRGKVTYIQEGASEASSLQVERGDVYNFEQGSVLYIQSYPNATRERLRIYAIFTSNAIGSDDPSHPRSQAYSEVSNLLKGFDVEILRLGFGVSPDVVEAIKSAKSPPSIIPYNPDQEKKKEGESNWTEDILDALWGVEGPLNKKKKKDKKDKKDKTDKSKTFNFYSGKPDVENCYGWSKTMTNKDLQNLKGSDIGMFMVNLTTGSMMGPHWNPKATEIAIVTYGSGIVQTVCPSSPSGAGGEGGRGESDHHEEGAGQCKNSVFRVKEGDVFVVPRFHPMAQMSFNNGSFVFVGFSTHMGQNHPQFLAGKQSVLQVIGKEILAVSLGQKNSSAVEKLLSAQGGSTIMACISCAEELERKAEQEEQEGGKGGGGSEEEERRRKEEEEQRKREEEEQRKREEEEKRRKEEEERARREEKERRQREEEEQRRREEEEAARRKEKERRQREEEEQRRREEEEAARRKEKERRQREEEEQRRREEEEEERRRREGGEGQGGGGDEPPREEEEERRRREEEEGRGGGGGRRAAGRGGRRVGRRFGQEPEEAVPCSQGRPVPERLKKISLFRYTLA